MHRAELFLETEAIVACFCRVSVLFTMAFSSRTNNLSCYCFARSGYPSKMRLLTMLSCNDATLQCLEQRTQRNVLHKTIQTNSTCLAAVDYCLSVVVSRFVPRTTAFNAGCGARGGRRRRPGAFCGSGGVRACGFGNWLPGEDLPAARKGTGEETAEAKRSCRQLRRDRSSRNIKAVADPAHLVSAPVLRATVGNGPLSSATEKRHKLPHTLSIPVRRGAHVLSSGRPFLRHAHPVLPYPALPCPALPDKKRAF